MDNDKITALKQKINAFIWEHAPDAMTIAQGEHAACVLLEAFLEAEGPHEELNVQCERCGCDEAFGETLTGEKFCVQCKDWKES